MKKIALLLALCLCLTACGPLKVKQEDVSSHIEESTTSTTASTAVTTETVTPGDVPTEGTTTNDTTVETTTTSTTHAVTTTSHPISTTIITRPTAAATTTTKKATTTTTTRTTTTTIKKTTTTKTITTTTTAKPTADKPDGVHTAMELEVFRLLNEERQSQGLAPLALSMEAHAAAEVRAEEASRNWSHTRPNGQSCFTVLDEFGISYWTAGENLAMGYRTGAALHNGWKNSAGHYENMMRPNFTSVAIAVYYTANGTPYACELFLGQ